MRYSIFFIFFLILSVISSGILLAGYQINIESLRNALVKREEARSEQILHNIKNLINSEINKLSYLAESVKFHRHLFQAFNSQDRSISKIQAAGRAIQAQIGLDIFEITDSNGVILYSFEPSRKPGTLSELWGIDEALDGEHPLIASRNQKNWDIRQFVPLQWGTQLYGTLNIGFKLNNIFIQQLSNITNTGLTITGMEGVIAGNQDFDTLSYDRLLSDDFWTQLAEGNQPLFIENSSQKQYIMYSAVKVVDETFCLILRTDTAGMYQLLNEKTQYLKLFFFVTLFAMIVCYLALTLYIARPLKKLQHKAEKLASLYSGEHLEISHTGNEIRQLEHAFNFMSDSVTHAVARREKSEAQALKARLVAESANQAKSKFISTMSHELRTPMNAVLGISQVMSRDQALSPEQKENLAIILSSGNHLLALINDILDLSKIESEKLVLKQENIDLRQMTDDLKKIIIDRARKKNISIEFTFSGDIPKQVRGDGTRLRQVLINLLGNAVKFTDQGTVSIEIATHKHSAQQILSTTKSSDASSIWIEFIVSDTGPGIESENLDHIFEAFFQTETGENAHEGTGLGLVISKNLIRMMGGTLKVSSKLGKGSRFSFQIPVEVADLGHISFDDPSYQIKGLVPGQSNFKILIVDDNPENRHVLASLLKPYDFDMREASDGKQAVSISKEWQPHLIWMDIQMPGMDGWDTAKAIRRQANKETSIIAISATAFDSQIKKSCVKWCDDYIVKPYHVDDIFKLLNKHLNVEFVYEARESTPSTNAAEGDVAQSFKTLPEDLLKQLVQAAAVLDPDKIYEIINEIDKLNSSLAESLKKIAGDYRYEHLLKVTQNALE